MIVYLIVIIHCIMVDNIWLYRVISYSPILYDMIKYHAVWPHIFYYSWCMNIIPKHCTSQYIPFYCIYQIISWSPLRVITCLHAWGMATSMMAPQCRSWPITDDILAAAPLPLRLGVKVHLGRFQAVHLKEMKLKMPQISMRQKVHLVPERNLKMTMTYNDSTQVSDNHNKPAEV